MLTALDAKHLDAYVGEPGVALLDWRHPASTASALLDGVLAEASRVHVDVRFGVVDVAREPALARDWEIREAPTLMAYRDGVLLFSRPGALPGRAIDDLIATIWALDMDEVRKRRNGHGGPTIITYVEDRERPFDVFGPPSETPTPRSR